MTHRPPTNTPPRFSGARLDDRQVTELIGIARGVLADGTLTDSEIDFIRRWLVANVGVTQNPLIRMLERRMAAILADEIVDAEERADLFELLHSFVANDFQLGEILRSTQLPLCNPPPHIDFDGQVFTFTGTFAFGSRKTCETAVEERGGAAGTLTRATRYLVIGEYVTDSWRQSTFGRKIEQAVDMRAKGHPIRIISEPHWRTSLW